MAPVHLEKQWKKGKEAEVVLLQKVLVAWMRVVMGLVDKVDVPENNFEGKTSILCTRWL